MENIITIKAKVDNFSKALANYSESVISFVNPSLNFIIPGKLVELNPDYTEKEEYEIDENLFRVDRSYPSTYRMYFYIKSKNKYNRVFIKIDKDNYEMEISDFIYGGNVDVYDANNDENIMNCQFIRK